MENCTLITRGVFHSEQNFLYKSSIYRNYTSDSLVTLMICICIIQVPPQSFGKEFGQLLESGEHADVTFKVEDETMNAHRLLLSTRSPVFAGMLRADMRENQEGIITIEDVKAPVFRALLHFIYTDSLPEVKVSMQTSHLFRVSLSKFAIVTTSLPETTWLESEV